MLFCLAPSFSKSLISGNVESIDFLTRLLDSRKRGLLLVYCSAKVTLEIKQYLKLTNNNHNIELFNTISKKFRAKKQLLEDLSIYVFVRSGDSNPPQKKGRMILTSPKFINRSNLLYPPILLGENLTDCDLYAEKISKFFTRDIPISMASLSLSDRFESGGGNSTHASYLRHKQKGIDLCFCIVDSDRNHPEEENGDTAKFVENVDKIKKSSICSHLVIDMYSAENLLPINEIERQYKEGKSEAQIKKFLIIRKFRSISSWRHIALKKGIKGNDIKKGDKKSNFWGKQINLIGENTICCSAAECSCVIVPNISDKTLSRSLQKEDINWSDSFNQEENIDIRSDYIKISTEIRSWLCVGSPLRS